MAADLADVVVYTLAGCVHCERARALLRCRGVPYREVHGEGDEAFWRSLHELTGRSTVPQIVIDGVPVGGAAELARLDRHGALLPLVRREPFPRAIVRRRLSLAGLLTAPLGGCCGLHRHVIVVVERDGRILERVPVRSAEQAAQLAGVLNERETAA